METEKEVKGSMGAKQIVQKFRAALRLEWQQETEEKSLSVTGHLDELRYRIIVALVTIGCCFAALYPLSENLLQFVQIPIERQLYMLAPAEAFIVRLKLAIFAAIVVSVPMLLYQVWAFIAPGLYIDEKRYALPFVLLATVCFGIGGVFAYKLILPFGLRFLLGYGGTLVQPMISVANYVTFVTRMILVFGAVFELPLIVAFLTKFGMLTPALMRSSRKYAIILAFVIGAVLTPPDLFTQTMMAGPLIVLYEISIWVSVFLAKSPEEEEEPA